MRSEIVQSWGGTVCRAVAAPHARRLWFPHHSSRKESADCASSASCPCPSPTRPSSFLSQPTIRSRLCHVVACRSEHAATLHVSSLGPLSVASPDRSGARTSKRALHSLGSPPAHTFGSLRDLRGAIRTASPPVAASTSATYNRGDGRPTSPHPLSAAHEQEMRELLAATGVLKQPRSDESQTGGRVEKSELRFQIMSRYVIHGSHPDVSAPSLRVMGMWWQVAGWMDDQFDPLEYKTKAEGERALQGLLDGFFDVFLCDDHSCEPALPSDDPHWRLLRDFSRQFSRLYPHPLAREVMCDAMRSWCSAAGEVPDHTLGVEAYMAYRRREVGFDSIAAIELCRCGLFLPREQRESKLGRLLDLFGYWHGAANDMWSYHRDAVRGRADDSSNLLAVLLRSPPGKPPPGRDLPAARQDEQPSLPDGSGAAAAGGTVVERADMAAAVDRASEMLALYEDEFDAEAARLCSDVELAEHSSAVCSFVAALRHWMDGVRHVLSTDTTGRYLHPSAIL